MPVSSITLTAPAKTNLSLRILGKRADGYHEIETLMAPITLADEIEISHAHGVTPGSVALTCSDPTLPTNTDNLCVKAAHAFQQATGITESITITLLKKIPHGAGLGGGSSDAAMVLRGMNTLFDEPLVLEELLELAATLGSDVPFFIEAKPAWCRGRGEILSEAPPLPSWNLLLIKPPFSIATPWAFSRLQGQKEIGTSHLMSSARNGETAPFLLDGISIFNDLEAPVFQKHLVLPVLKSWLKERSEVTTAWMSGSGSTMVAALHPEASAEKIALLKKEIAANFGETFWMKETLLAQAKPLDK